MSFKSHRMPDWVLVFGGEYKQSVVDCGLSKATGLAWKFLNDKHPLHGHHLHFTDSNTRSPPAFGFCSVYFFQKWKKLRANFCIFFSRQWSWTYRSFSLHKLYCTEFTWMSDKLLCARQFSGLQMIRHNLKIVKFLEILMTDENEFDEFVWE